MNNTKTQRTFFDRKNPITIRRQFEDNIQQRQINRNKKNKNIEIHFNNISSRVLDIPDIFSHSIEKYKNARNLPFDKISRIKQNKSQEKNLKIRNKRDIFDYPVNNKNNNFSLSNINYYPNKSKNKNILNNSISINESNTILKDIENNYHNKNKNRNNNISTSLPKIKIRK